MRKNKDLYYGLCLSINDVLPFTEKNIVTLKSDWRGTFDRNQMLYVLYISVEKMANVKVELNAFHGSVQNNLMVPFVYNVPYVHQLFRKGKRQ